MTLQYLDRQQMIEFVEQALRESQPDIDHPAVQAGVDTLFGHHPERGGQEREQAVFAVLQAAIPHIVSDEFAVRIVERLEAEGVITGKPGDPWVMATAPGFHKRIADKLEEILGTRFVDAAVACQVVDRIAMDERNQRIRQAVQAGVSVRELAEQLGLSRKQVYVITTKLRNESASP